MQHRRQTEVAKERRAKMKATIRPLAKTRLARIFHSWLEANERRQRRSADSNLLYRQLPVGSPFVHAMDRRAASGLETRDTADWKSALQSGRWCSIAEFSRISAIFTLFCI